MASEKHEKSKLAKHIPKDAQVICSILKEIGVTDYEPRVINQLLEFTYRYVTCTLDDAKLYANHAKKKVIDMKDVKLASTMLLDKAFTTPPPRDVLMDIARTKNNTPLPPIKAASGLRLPPDRYCLSACNYKLRAAAPPKKMVKGGFDPSKNQMKSTALKKQNPASAPPKTQNINIPKPVFKFTSTKPAAAKPKLVESEQQEIKMEVDDSEAGLKRKREDDEFEIVG